MLVNRVAQPPYWMERYYDPENASGCCTLCLRRMEQADPPAPPPTRYTGNVVELAGACPWCKQRDFWISEQGVKVCAVCHPGPDDSRPRPADYKPKGWTSAPETRKRGRSSRKKNEVKDKPE